MSGAQLRITKHAHACVRIEQLGEALVIDPGAWSEGEAFENVDAVLVTHDHGDHADRRRLPALGAPVHAPAGAEIDGVEFVEVRADDEFFAAGLPVRAVGADHAPVYWGRPAPAHLGYVIDERCYHPGDSLHVPDERVEVLFVPLHGSWMKVAEAIDFIKHVDPVLAVGIHDGQINERGLASANDWLQREAGSRYHYLAPGEAITP